MAVKLAHAMGAEVTVLSQSLKKQEDGLRLGADHYYATSDPDTFSELAGSFDLIINTVSASHRHRRLPAAPGPRRHPGQRRRPGRAAAVNVFSLIRDRRSFAGSMIGGIRETQEMLDFCAEHGIGAEIEVIPAGRSTRPTNASWPPMSATASSSTPPPSDPEQFRVATRSGSGPPTYRKGRKMRRMIVTAGSLAILMALAGCAAPGETGSTIPATPAATASADTARRRHRDSTCSEPGPVRSGITRRGRGGYGRLPSCASRRVRLPLK